MRGCGEDLTQGSAYMRRTRLCAPHSRAESVEGADGVAKRWCQARCAARRDRAASHSRRLQKCNRLQPVSIFAGSNRTCMAKLAQHNERRREAYAARKGPNVTAVL